MWVWQPASHWMDALALEHHYYQILFYETNGIELQCKSLNRSSSCRVENIIMSSRKQLYYFQHEVLLQGRSSLYYTSWDQLPTMASLCDIQILPANICITHRSPTTQNLWPWLWPFKGVTKVKCDGAIGVPVYYSLLVFKINQLCSFARYNPLKSEWPSLLLTFHSRLPKM